MALTPRRKRIVATVILLAAVVAIFLFILRDDSAYTGRLKLPTGSGTPAIALGERHGLILASDGSLWSWGSDFLGWPVLGQTNHLKSRRLLRIGADTNWVSISAANTHNLALKSDGTLWTWGASTTSRYTKPSPIPAPILAAPGNDWKQAAAGAIHSLAIKRDGTLWGWGNNWAGSVGIDSASGGATPVQIGTGTNWIKVWASTLESVALQSDGSLWYWGDNPDPSAKQDQPRIATPTRVNADTNWIDVGFGVNTVFAIKSDGTLWTWGRQADVYTGATNITGDITPVQVGTNTDWRSLCATTGWWISGLTKKDGSLWVMDASQQKPNGPRPPYTAPQFRQIAFEKPVAAYAAGAVHAAESGIHGPIGVILTPDGEVWTWSMELGDPSSAGFQLMSLGVSIARFFHLRNVASPDAPPVYHNTPWQLRNVDPNTPR